MKKLGAVIIGLGLIIGLFLVVASTERVPQGHVGVVFSPQHGVRDTTLGQGWTMIAPWDNLTVFPVSVETVDVSEFNVLTRDGKPLALRMSYDFSVNAEYVTGVFDMFRGQNIDTIQSSWLEDRAMRAAITVFSSYSVMDVFSNLPSIQVQIFEEFRNIVAEYGFNIASVTLQAPEMDEQTMAAIQEVVNAQQELERMQIELLQAEVRANTRIEEARGRAESTLVEAEAQAEANQLLQESITNELIQMEIARQWNGVLPVVSGDSGNILDITGVVTAE